MGTITPLLEKGSALDTLYKCAEEVKQRTELKAIVVLMGDHPDDFAIMHSEDIHPAQAVWALEQCKLAQLMADFEPDEEEEE